MVITWTAEYNLDPINFKLTGDVNPVNINCSIYFSGVKIGSITLKADARDACVSGKVNNGTKVEVCLKLSDDDRKVIVGAKACLLGACKKWDITFDLPVPFDITEADFLS
ncbi:hypothetical protein [Paenibacillus massiliensis]|uniref:hypothetical protein n=1 Tax=Paenibacillus massiliensis TaxID=225917 RepID=UPI00146A69EF|nr:hypothetical protein [Paenibacillus massiliensis]